jgi:4-hydroxybenzoate polyprenyltransferase
MHLLFCIFSPENISGFAVVPLVVAYPLMKRFIHVPQLFLGLTFNWGALMGWSAVMGAYNWAVMVPLFTSSIFWTLFYDTIYAHQDKADDVKVGIRSSALFFAENTKPILAASAVLSSATLGFAALSAGQSVQIAALASGAALGHMVWQLWRVDLDSQHSCMQIFKSNAHLGWVVVVLFIAGNVYLFYTKPAAQHTEMTSTKD